MSNDSGEKIGAERRSSVRVRSLLPCAARRIDADEIPAIESRILDLAVVESDHAHQSIIDWKERTEDLSRDMLYILSELRAMRQRVSEMQRLLERKSKPLEPRWLVINDSGLWIPAIEGDPQWALGDYMEVRLQIPSLASPEILAVGEVIRVDDNEEGPGSPAVEFKSISEIHSKAIIHYALRRERQLARSRLFKMKSIQ